MNDNKPDLMAPITSYESTPENNSYQPPKKEKKEIKSWVGILIFAIIGTLIAGSVYFYCTKDNKKEDEESKAKPTATPTPTATPVPTSAPVVDQTLSVTDPLVLKLYGYIDGTNLDVWASVQSNFEISNKTKLNASDLSTSVKNFLAFRQLSTAEYTLKNCSEFSHLLAYNKGSNYNGNTCGSTYTTPNGDGKYDDRNNQTYVIEPSILKAKVESMFGSNTYQNITFSYNYGEIFEYDATTGKYIKMSCTACGGTSGPRATTSLMSATKTATNIQIVELLTARIANGQDRDKDTKIRHVFKNINGNYVYDYSELIA